MKCSSLKLEEEKKNCFCYFNFGKKNCYKKKGRNTASLQDRAKALIFIHHHIDEGLKPMLQFKLIDVGMGVGMDIIDKAEVVVLVAIILGIELIIISLKNKNNTSNNQKLNRSEKLSGKAIGPHNKKVYETGCYRCGMKGH